MASAIFLSLKSKSFGVYKEVARKVESEKREDRCLGKVGLIALKEDFFLRLEAWGVGFIFNFEKLEIKFRFFW